MLLHYCNSAVQCSITAALALHLQIVLTQTEEENIITLYQKLSSPNAEDSLFSTHPHVDGKLGEDSENTKHFWGFTASSF